MEQEQTPDDNYNAEYFKVSGQVTYACIELLLVLCIETGGCAIGKTQQENIQQGHYNEVDQHKKQHGYQRHGAGAIGVYQ